MDLVEKKNKARLPEKSKECLIKRSMNLLKSFWRMVSRKTDRDSNQSQGSGRGNGIGG